MGFEPVEPEQRQLLRKALEDARLSVPEVWMKYFSIGGGAGEYEVDAYVNGSLSLPSLQRDILAHAANELIDQLPARPRAPSSTDVHRHRAAGSGAEGSRTGRTGSPPRHRRDPGED